MIRKAVIVAAGLSSRLYPLTASTPKPLLEVGGETLLERSMRLLRDAGITDIGVVVGFKSDLIEAVSRESATSIPNPFYRHCNNMGSLWMARHFVANEPFAYLHGDLIYADDMLSSFMEESNESSSLMDLLVDFGATDEEAMKVKTDDARRLIKSSKGVSPDEAAGEWTGIASVHDSLTVFAAIENHLMTQSLTDYDTAAFNTLAAGGREIRCLPTNGKNWREIDDLADLEAAHAALAAV